MSDGYNGWRNWETWNVALWIGNDEPLYRLARRCRNMTHPYRAFLTDLREMVGGTRPLATPDGALYDDDAIDTDAIDEMIRES